MRIAIVILICLVSTPTIAATVALDAGHQAGLISVAEVSFYKEILASQNKTYRDAPGPAPIFVAGIVGYILLIALYAGCFVSAIPGRRGWRYARAVVATSRMRWTIARRPFERWDDR